ncbi:PIN domain-containing protein [Sphingoaurantiacus capsulatus]|uniref:PIN domain-containing protein n=1 Tax=Sphingoaurantiacus capsulatus TaxID=1771310 RepID=A0ABV7X7A0_9SPHN
MRAVDTNVLLRAIVNDDAAQAALAHELLRDDCFVSTSVLLETAWVLKSYYGFDRAQLAAALLALLSAETVHVVHPERVGRAMAGFAAGADFADMIHLAEATDFDAFVTFDRALASLADPPVPVELLR